MWAFCWTVAFSRRFSGRRGWWLSFSLRSAHLATAGISSRHLVTSRVCQRDHPINSRIILHRQPTIESGTIGNPTRERGNARRGRNPYLRGHPVRVAPRWGDDPQGKGDDVESPPFIETPVRHACSY